MRKLLCLLLLFALCAGHISAQNRIISGKVSDEKGGPLPNTSVVIKGSNSGSTTKDDGTYTLQVPKNTKAIVISLVGMGSKEIALSETDIYNVSLTSVAKGLDEIVILGYGSRKKVDVTAAVATVKAPDLENRPFTSVDQMLQGKVPGLQAPLLSGQPGAAQSIRIRGIGSVVSSAAANPLYVVDGMIINAGDLSSLTATANTIAGINANDIESITVLKDAQATSIYGSRGANGVILITTKTGKAGKTKFRLDAEAGITKLADLPDNAKFLNADEWLSLLEEGLRNAGRRQGQIDTTMAGFGKGNGVNTNWLDLITRQGSQQQYNLSASGGDDKNQFYVSGGYFKQDAPVINSDFKRYAFRTNYKHISTDKLNFNVSLSGSNSIQHTPSGGGAFANPVSAVPFLRPTQNPYNADGSYNINTTGNDFASTFNPLYIAKYNKYNLNATLFQGYIGGEYAILNNLKFTSKYGIDFNNLEEYRFWNQYHGDGKSYGGSGDANNTRYFNWTFTNQLDYSAYVGKDQAFRVNAKLGYESQKSKGYFVNTRAEGFPPPNELTLTTNAATVKDGKVSASEYDFAGAFASGGISYEDKYILEGSFRRDGSSRFSDENKYGNFWSVGGAWNVQKEKFMDGVSFVSDVKLRGSYGLSGNAAIGNYLWRQTYGFGSNYNGLPGGSFNVIGNSDLTWESTVQSDIGLDASFLNDRISIVFDLYKRVSDRLLFAEPISRTTGFTSVTRNVGKLENKGFEFSINTTPVKSQNFNWNISFNISNNKNRVRQLPGGKDIIDGAFILREGYDYRTFYVREWAGVDPANGDPLWYVDGSHAKTTNDYNSATRQLLKSASPKFFGGVTNSISYKGFGLDADFVYNYGNTVRDPWIFYSIDGTDPTSGKTKLNLQRWQKPGDITNVPRYVYQLANNSSSFSTRFLYKGDFIRLRNITLGYTANDKLVKRLHGSSIHLYLRGTNLFTKTYDKNLTVDPEQGINGSANLDIFYARIFTAGINIGF
ncbi:MAG: TonB-dependent receptor [Chitinophagaceae bacterium]